MDAPPPYDENASSRTSASSTTPLGSSGTTPLTPSRLRKDQKPYHDRAHGGCNIHSEGGCMNIHSRDGCLNIHSEDGCMNIHSRDGCCNIHSENGCCNIHSSDGCMNVSFLRLLILSVDLAGSSFQSESES
jgi:hypothetical protein